jgi:peptidoglycan/xylan/chitin deacetylase (PgdA/CDA1 family)
MSLNRIVTFGFIVLLISAMLYDWYNDMPFWIYVVLILSYLIIHIAGSFNLSMRFFLPVKYKGKPESNAIAITFDDGPVPGKTEKILEILSQYKVLATFFCIGNRIDKHPALVKRIYNEGHLLANHTYWHGKTFDLQSSAKIEKELLDTDVALKKAVGLTPRFFRPPYGVTNPMVASAVKQRGYETIGWSVRSFDTITQDSSVLMKRVTKSLKAGDMILFHDYCDVTIEILPALLEHINKLGLKIVRADELLNEKAYVEEYSLPKSH